jgi:hypothetical protein
MPGWLINANFLANLKVLQDAQQWTAPNYGRHEC